METSQEARPCTKCMTFFGSAKTNWMCSSCFKTSGPSASSMASSMSTGLSAPSASKPIASSAPISIPMRMSVPATSLPESLATPPLTMDAAGRPIQAKKNRSDLSQSTKASFWGSDWLISKRPPES
eukprot:m.545464 g.545464  ORF g.545464 m.545464 type:complete len:126 (-) comp57672_c0_seq4:584-961(-)